MAATNITIPSGTVVGSYDNTVISENPRRVKVFGDYDTTNAPKGGGGDALHSFENRTKDEFGGKMHTIINVVLKDFYTTYKINPYVESIAIDMNKNGQGPIVKWEVIVAESPDGKAYVGFSSRGGAGPKDGENGSIKRAENQTIDKKKKLPSEVSPKEPQMEFKDILDYRNDKVYIRQIFFNYTRPIGFPPLPKTANSGVASGTSGTAGTAGTAGSSGVVDPKTLPSTITLKKKSGPGEIMGETQREIYFGEAEFAGVQFDQPGTYVVSVIPSAPEFEPTEFTIVVTGDPQPKEQEPRGKEEEKVEGSRPIIAQIDKPTIILKPIEYKKPNDNGKQQDSEIAYNLGFTPFFWYMGYQIMDRDIRQLKLYHEKMIPMVNITFADSLGLMKKDGFPLDNTKFEVFLNLLNIKYISSFYINYKKIHYIYDFYLPDCKTLIEVDGDFWHCNPNSKYSLPKCSTQKINIINDQEKNQWAKDNGYKLLRFWETDINNNPTQVIETIKKELGIL
jgi:very-short-patch-repair endonuclease